MRNNDLLQLTSAPMWPKRRKRRKRGPIVARNAVKPILASAPEIARRGACECGAFPAPFDRASGLHVCLDCKAT